MNCEYGDAHYTTRSLNNKKEGSAGLELHRLSKGKKDRVATIIFRDASGQFFLETFNTDLPLAIVEELVAEAKATIRTQ